MIIDQIERFLGSLVVIVGEYDLSHDAEKLKPVAKPVKRMIIHRDYNPNTFENDIALLELESSFDIQPHVVPICLPEDDDDFVGQKGYVAGWGKLSYGNQSLSTFNMSFQRVFFILMKVVLFLVCYKWLSCRFCRTANASKCSWTLVT